MKKNQLLLLSLIIWVLYSNSNTYSQQGFAFDFSVGYGAHRGGLGGKLTIDNLVFVGLGVLDSQPLVQLGFQYRFFGQDSETKKEVFNSPYIAVSYGGIGVQTESYTVIYQDEPYTETNAINGFTILGGYLIRLGSNFFLEGGAGYSFGKAKFFEGTSYAFEYSLDTFTIDVGLGYRF